MSCAFGTVSPARPYPIVAVGHSAHATERLHALLSCLGRDGAAYVLVQSYRAPDSGPLAFLFRDHWTLPVRMACHGDVLEPDVVYVLPPGRYLSLLRGTVQLGLTAPAELPAIDGVFEMVAQLQGSACAGVLLSERTQEGEHGLRRIRDAGGATFVHRPPAQANDPPGTRAVVSDYQTLQRLAAELRGWSRRFPHGHGLDGAILSELIDQLQRGYGVDLSEHKAEMIRTQVQTRIAERRVECARDYLALLEASEHEPRALLANLLIGSTRFFRDPEVFQALREQVLPALLAESPAAPLRAWVAGCSSGEEAYSLAMLLHECTELLGHQGGIRIFATDISDEALAKARAGVYRATIQADVSPERLARFFVPVAGGFRVRRQLRDTVLFARHDLLRDPPYGRLHLVSCRNLLMYLERDAQQRALEHLHYGLRQNGVLVLGGAESTLAAEGAFTPLDREHRLYVRRQRPQQAPPPAWNRGAHPSARAGSRT